MHIVFVTIELATDKNPSGGLASFTSNMAQILTKHNHKVTIILFTLKENDIEFDENIALEKICVKKREWEFYNKAARLISLKNEERQKMIRICLINIAQSLRIRRKIKEIDVREKVDIVHYCNLKFPALFVNKRIPYVIRISSLMNICRAANERAFSPGYCNNRRRADEKVMEYVIKKARAVVSPSRLLADIMEEELRIKAKILESPYMFNRNEWDAVVYETVLHNKKYILHFGRQSYLKGTHILAELVYSILDKHRDIFVVMAGADDKLSDENTGEYVEAHELVEKRAGGYSDRVIYLGKLVQNKLFPVIENAEICFLPYRFDNLPNACIEAMAMGRIVVGTNGASFEQLICDGKSGFLGERDRPETYLECLERALAMGEEEKKRMRQNAVKRVEQLAPDRIYENYMKFYGEVIDHW